MSAQSIVESRFPADRLDPRLSLSYLQRLQEMARAKTQPMGSYNSGGFTSKMWLLPDGTTVSLSQQHSEWLKANPGVTKKFKLDLSKVPDEDTPIRLAALGRGFIRLNYEQRNGQLTVEAGSRWWSKTVKDTLFVLVADNINRIDAMLVNLLDERGKVVRHGYSQLFTYRGQEKLEHLPLITESRRGRALLRFGQSLLA